MSDFDETPESDEAHEVLIAALLAQPSHEAAAKAVGISTATLRRRLADPVFVAQFRAVRTQLIQVVVGRLQSIALKAVEALERNLSCGKSSDEVKAATAVLTQAHRAAELLDVLARIDVLEQKVGQP